MKRMFRLISVLLCLSLLFSCFSMTGLAARADTNEEFRLYGDIDGDGTIEEADFLYIMDILAGNTEMPDALSAEFYAADIMGDGITMEDARRVYRYLNDMDTVATYTAQDRWLKLYNDIVGVIKSSEFQAFNKVSYYNVTNMHTETTNFDFGAYTTMIKGIFDEEMEDEVDYSPLYSDSSVYYIAGSNRTNFPMFENGAVSLLRPSDIKNIAVEIGVPCAFSADAAVPQSFVRGNTTYDLTGLTTQEAQYTDCIKITVDIKDESYVNHVSKLNPEDKPAFYNFFGSDVRELAAQYPFEEDGSAEGMIMVMKMDLVDINTQGKAIYYFDRATLNPICAYYKTVIDTKQNVTMNFGVDGLTINGTMDPRTVSTSSYIYWFGPYFSGK